MVPATAAKSAKYRRNRREWPIDGGTRSGPVAGRDMAPTHIPQSENICSQYDNNVGQEPKVGLSRAAQRIGFALWVIAYGAFARHPSLSVTGSH
ncbi:hypothetical protein FBZ93_107295 [Bradyrhizobium macuxiense]|uniref:Uncharacterized protein n=1 Tax=Bradyrhizobium macuxiense TaxID=1755647 RepID=A0A560LP96_9BRAD|nr:hypothetical protein FBZ93_107295 [Bradyrhizobium macuxiense]